MTPEENMGRVVRSVCPDCGHWPYTVDADVFIGWRPETDGFDQASARSVRCAVKYDLVIVHRRGADLQAERTRFALYAALKQNSWRIVDCGPEEYNAATQQFFWPVTAVKGFGLDQNRQPYDLLSRE